MIDEDRDLRERYSALKDEEQAAIPPLDRVLSRRRGGEVRSVRPSVVAFAVAATALVALVVLPFREPVPRAPVPSLTEWRSPTDFLLVTPAREVLETVPRLGEGMLPPDSTERRTSS